MHPLRKILGEFIRDFGIEGGAVLHTIKNKWADIVGQTIAVHTVPDIIKGGILTVIVDTPQWMHHLSFYKSDIMEKLWSYNIREIRFRLGRIPEREDKESRTKEANLSEEDLRFIRNTLQYIKDEELKEKFEKLISHGLTRGKKVNIKDKD